MGKIEDAVRRMIDASGGVGLSDAECDAIANEIKSAFGTRRPSKTPKPLQFREYKLLKST